jgi:hypothetical protein
VPDVLGNVRPGRTATLNPLALGHWRGEGASRSLFTLPCSARDDSDARTSRTVDNVIDGVVITSVDIHSLRGAWEENRRLSEGLSVVHREGRPNLVRLTLQGAWNGNGGAA